MIDLHHHRHQRPLHIIGIFVCLIGLVAIAFSITLRAIPNAANPHLQALLPVSRAALNHLHGSFQYELLVALIFSGLLVDIIGPRTILVISVFIAIAANYVFGSTDSIFSSMTSRVLISFSQTFLLTSVLTLGTHWLPRRHFSLFVGLLFATTLITPLLVTPFLQKIMTREGLQQIIHITNLFGILVIIGILATEPITDRTQHRHTFDGLLKPLTHYKVWLIGLVAMLGWMSNTFTLDFGTFYLIKHYHLDPLDAIKIIRTAFFYFGFGAIFMGLVSDYFEEKRFLIGLCYFLAAITYCVLIFLPNLSVWTATHMLYMTAFYASSTIICYTKANDYCTIGNSGIALGLVLSISNIGNIFFGGMMSHLLHDFIISSPENGNITHWEITLTIIPFALILGAIISILLLKPVHLKPIAFVRATNI